MRTVYPVGTTLYKPDKCCNGYTILWRGQKVKLIDMNGQPVNEWLISEINGADAKSKAGVDRARLLENGNVLVQRGGMMSEDGLLQEYDWEHNLVWEYVPEGGIPHKKLLGPHHDVYRKSNGNTLTICHCSSLAVARKAGGHRRISREIQGRLGYTTPAQVRAHEGNGDSGEALGVIGTRPRCPRLGRVVRIETRRI